VDEESIGILGLLLIVTAVVMSQSLQKSHAMPLLAGVSWHGVVNALSCATDDNPDCPVVMDQARSDQSPVPSAYIAPVSR
jgi:hypothetical protein